MSLSALLAQVIPALLLPPVKKRLVLQFEFWMAAVLLFLLAGVFALIAGFIWLRTEFGAFEAAVLMCLGMIVLGIGCLIVAKLQERRRKRLAALESRSVGHSVPDLAVLAIGFLDGLRQPSRPKPRTPPASVVRTRRERARPYTNGAAHPRDGNAGGIRHPLG